MKAEIATIDNGQGSSFAIAGGAYRIILSGQMTGGNYAVIEMQVPPGAGPSPHAHADIPEMFYVVEGEVAFTTEAGTYVASQGCFVNIPLGGQVHCFKNRSEHPATLLCTVVPAGLDDFFSEIGIPIEEGKEVPLLKPDADEIKRIQLIGKRYGQEFYPADYFEVRQAQ